MVHVVSRARLPALLLGATWVLAGCRGATKSSAPDASPRVVLAASATTASAPDASVPVSGPRALVNLIEEVPTQIGVSSSVDNPRDKPEHLIDHNPRTAWNSKTGDLVDGFIAFRIPDDAHVAYAELIVGFDRVLPSGEDLFTQNHRITKVAVARVVDGGYVPCRPPHVPEAGEGPEYGGVHEVVLDPNVRGFQRIPIDEPGGAFCMWVKETRPGAKKDWRELTVSEFRVMGKPGAARRDPKRSVEIGVGKLPPPIGSVPVAPYDGSGVVECRSENEMPKKAFASVGALCAAFVAGAHKRIAAATRPDNMYPPALGSESCAEAPLGVPFTPAGPFLGATAVQTKNGWSKQRTLVVKLKSGFVATDIDWDWESYVADDARIQWADHGRESVRVENESIVVVRDYLHVSSSPLEYEVYPAVARGVDWCTPTSSGELRCQRIAPDVAGALALKELEGERDVKVVDALAWTHEVAFTIDAKGELRVKTP